MNIKEKTVIRKYLKSAIILSVLLGLSACGTPNFTGTALEPAAAQTTTPVVVVRDDATKRGFLETIENWLSANGYAYDVAPDGSGHDPEKLTLEYVGDWAWDLALYLQDAQIDAYKGGRKIAGVRYHVPKVTLNPNKFSVASERISMMLDVLFGKISAAEARNKMLAPRE